MGQQPARYKLAIVLLAWLEGLHAIASSHDVARATPWRHQSTLSLLFHSATWTCTLYASAAKSRIYVPAASGAASFEALPATKGVCSTIHCNQLSTPALLVARNAVRPRPLHCAPRCDKNAGQLA